MFEPKTETINNDIAVRARLYSKGERVLRDKWKYTIINPWIGIRHLHDENRTVFASSNSEVPWSYWEVNEPNNVNAGEDCTHLYTPPEYDSTAKLNDCNGLIKHYIANRECNDETNTEECAWDGGDCCGDIVNTVDMDGNPTCSSCQCPAQLAKWNDNSCEELRTFICEKEGIG